MRCDVSVDGHGRFGSFSYLPDILGYDADGKGGDRSVHFGTTRRDMMDWSTTWTSGRIKEKKAVMRPR